jgi:SAM-dependent methyltransferase/uncharacterized iron-regulated protein
VQLSAAALVAPFASCSQFSTQSSYRSALLSLRQAVLAQPLQQADVDDLRAAKLVVFGEIHEAPPCVELQCRTAACMLGALHASGSDSAVLHIVLEHFNFEAQPSLSAYAAGGLSFAALAETGAYEGHDISIYQPLLELSRTHPGRVHLHAGFIPRHYARIVMREGLQPALAAAKAKGYVADSEECAGTDDHYNFFESLLTGRCMHDTTRPPCSTYRAMFPAQIIKDAAMAHKVAQLIDSAPPDDRFLVVCGVGHSGYSHGVPERIFASHPALRQRSVRILSLPLPPGVDTGSPQLLQRALADELGAYGASGPADICLVFAEGGDEDPPPACHATADSFKSETAAAYNNVGRSAHLPGDQRRARAVMTRLGYTDDQIITAGCDSPNFQGVGNPHPHAAIQKGQAVLDIGSGLGIDSFIAAHAVGEAGSVIGVDIADRQVQHAAARAAARGLTQLRFQVGDLEHLPLPSDCVDVVISNGAFCLAPDKPAALREVARVLKPGGRFAICTSVVKAALEPGSWPLCMRMFAELSSLQPACEAAGLVRVRVDLSDSLMAFELPEEAGGGEEEADHADGGSRRRRSRVHVGSPEFEHLARYDMNELCARIVLVGEKKHPSAP